MKIIHTAYFYQKWPPQNYENRFKKLYLTDDS